MQKLPANEIKKAIQAKIARLMELQNLAETYQQIIQLNTTALTEIIQTKAAINELKKRKEPELSGYVSLGAGVFVEGVIKRTEKLLVDVGANLAVPMALDEAITVLEKKEKDIRTNIERMQKVLVEIKANINNLNREIEMLRKHLETVEKS